MSWTSAASRTTGWATAASTVPSVWSQRSSPGILFWGTPACTASSGRTAASRPVDAMSRSPTEGRSAARIRSSSIATRSPGEVGGERRARGDRRERRGLDLEAERRGEAHRPEHPQRVLLEPRARVADRAQRPRGRVREPAERVDQARRLARRRAPGHRVDGEVAAGEVGLERRPELDPVGPPEVGVVVLAPERRDLVLGLAPPHRHRPERVLVRGVGEDGERLVGQRVGREIPVLRRLAQRRVAERPADDVHGVSGTPQRGHQLANRVGNGPGDRAGDGGAVDRGTVRGRVGFGPVGLRPGHVDRLSSGPGTGTSATPRCADRRGTA